MTTTPATLLIKNGLGESVLIQGDVVSGVFIARSTPSIGGLQVAIDNPLPTLSILAALTTNNADAFTVVTGGQAVIAFGASTITNRAVIINPAGQNNGPLFVDAVHSPTISAPGTNGTTEIIMPGDRWVAPGPLVKPVYVNSENPQSFTAYRF